jgi:hypothetical protein
MVSIYSMYYIFFDLKGLFIRVMSSSICSFVPIRFVSPTPAWKINTRYTLKIVIDFWIFASVLDKRRASLGTSKTK